MMLDHLEDTRRMTQVPFLRGVMRVVLNMHREFSQGCLMKMLSELERLRWVAQGTSFYYTSFTSMKGTEPPAVTKACQCFVSKS